MIVSCKKDNKEAYISRASKSASKKAVLDAVKVSKIP
jgi:hypothetical protein